MFDKSVKRDRSITDHQHETAVGGTLRAASTSIVRRRGIRRSAALAPLIFLAVLVVTLFPSAAVSGIVITTLTPTADAYVNQDTPSTNYGTSPDLKSGTTPITRSYLKFVVPPLSGPVTNATLRLFATTSSTTGFEVRSAGTGWNEGTITYASGQPSRSSTITATSGPVTAGTWVELNVTSLVSSNSTKSFALTGTAVPAAGLASRESGNQPQLVVNVNDTAAPAVTLTTPGANARTGALPRFAGKAGNAPGDSPTVTVKVYAGSTPTGDVLREVPATRSGTNWSVTMPEGSDLPNGTYTARAEQQDAAGNTGFSSPRIFRVIQVIVTLQFDDGTENQYQARAMLAAHGGMDATFFVNSAVIGSNPFYMTWQQLNDLYADGSEIAGHTMYHADLTTSDPDEAGRQVCYDRNNLLAHGFPVTDFAYPFGAYNASTEALAQACGFNSARGTESFEGLCAPLCAESIPPLDLYATRVAGVGPNGLTALENRVTDAEKNGGGWIQLLFHGLCTSCGVNGTSPTTFNSLLTWLQPRATSGTIVRTVQQVIGGTVQPPVSGPALPPAPNGTNVIRNSSLEQDANNDGVPDCYRINSWGTHTATWTRTTDAHTGTYAERVDTTGYVDGADIIQTWDDLGYCTPTVIPGHQYTLSIWYKSTAPVRFSTNTRDDLFTSPFLCWSESPSFPVSSDWAEATWTTPSVAAGVSGMLFGLMLTSNGSLTVDDVSIVDANPSP
jgi:peptidoglycan/xylan/chitin deacetylase (PgdA/CDA1 family)